MGRTNNAYSHNTFKFKCVEYTDDTRQEVVIIKLYSSINEMERIYGVSKRTIPKYIDNDMKRRKLNNISITSIKPLPRFNVIKRKVIYDKEQIEYDTELLNSI